MQCDRELDVQGLNCPLPILRTKKALSEMASGQVLRVLATDAHAVKDFEAFATHSISVDVVATSEVSVSLTVDGKKANLAGLRHDLEKYASIDIRKDKAMLPASTSTSVVNAVAIWLSLRFSSVSREISTTTSPKV